MSEPSACAAYRLHILKTTSWSSGGHYTWINLGVHWLPIFFPLASIFAKYLIQVPWISGASEALVINVAETIRKKEAAAKQNMLGEKTYTHCFLPVVGKGSFLFFGMSETTSCWFGLSHPLRSTEGSCISIQSRRPPVRLFKSRGILSNFSTSW